jgi:hypothetical protein
MRNVLILGAGHFGSRAADILRNEGTRITVADQDPAALQKLAGRGYGLVCVEASALGEELSPLKFDFVVPAVPVHVLFQWLLAAAKREGIPCRPIAVPREIKVPHPFYLDGTLYASLASHRCPGDCPEPEGYCYLTGDSRELPLYRLLTENQDSPILVAQSHQLAPGVGGIAGRDFQRILDELRNRFGIVLVATSCSCHAVISALHCGK